MNDRKKSLNEKLDRAINSSNLQELKTLVAENTMIIRRALAKNINISADIANALAFDPVLNVSYAAVNNPRCTVKRVFEECNLVSCVVCDKDERQLDCVNCESKKTFR